MMASASAWNSGAIFFCSFFFAQNDFFFSCDQTSNCIDESDEDNCKLLSMKVGTNLSCEFCIYVFFLPKDNYNKKIAPFSFDKVLKAVIPVNINVSMSVIDILKIEEVDHIYVLKFRLVLEW